MSPPITRERYDAVLFDMDGVLTATAAVHCRSWKEMFDAYLAGRASKSGGAFEPFDEASDYRRYLDGRLRYDGVRSFLRSRGIELPEGAPEDPPDAETVCGLGNRKDRYLKKALAEGGVEAYEGSVALVRRVRADGLRTAVVTASHNARAVIESAGISDLFDAWVDGNLLDREGLAGKPAPDPFLAAAKLLGVEPARAVVIEDAIAGVQAGRAGGFGLVVGVDRHGDADSLKAGGADLVVRDLAELVS
jgi:beta-phosphoglucomutase family hydrolase